MFLGSDSQLILIGLGNSLAANSRQAIMWTNVDQFL